MTTQSGAWPVMVGGGVKHNHPFRSLCLCNKPIFSQQECYLKLLKNPIEFDRSYFLFNYLIDNWMNLTLNHIKISVLMSYFDNSLIHCIFEIYFVSNQSSFQNRSDTTQFVAYWVVDFWFWYKNQNKYAAMVSERHILVIVFTNWPNPISTWIAIVQVVNLVIQVICLFLLFL